ncbi:MAG TPA: CvpA family protein [Patescibacteria group bacterium]|nr:CvpA family protein [Patescibacteria group bacterium]
MLPDFLSFNPVDCVILLIFLFYVLEDISFGAIASGISLASTVIAFFIGLSLYPFASKFIGHALVAPKGISDAVSFLVISMLGFFLVTTLLATIRRKFITVHFPKVVDVIGGIIFGSISFFFIAAFIISLLLSFPTTGFIKDAVRNSAAASFFGNRAQVIDTQVRKIFGGAIGDTINFLTVKPNSDESVKLNFKTTSYIIDINSEARMLELVNDERRKAGLAELTSDSTLLKLARSHAKDMLTRGYFSHYTPEGLSPFDRMAQVNVDYEFAGENLAFAPDVDIAMDGLMKSPGHRENILSSKFGKVGIGVLDAGIYGKMFVQEFTD